MVAGTVAVATAEVEVAIAKHCRSTTPSLSLDGCFSHSCTAM